MPFTFKLSQRLARMRCAALLLATATVAACETPGSVATPLGPGAPLVQVIVSPDSIILDPAQQMRFAAYGRSASGDSAAVTVNWSATGGSITPQGLFTADTASGDFLVRAYSQALTLSGSSRVHIRQRPVTAVVVIPASASVHIGLTVQLTATPQDAAGNALSGRGVTWTSSDAGMATVSGSGLVTGLTAGLATITATSEGKRGTSAITVTQIPVAAVSVSPATASLTPGQTVQLAATPTDASGNPLTGRVVTWTSSNGAVAAVSGSGLVSALAAGSATITASSEGQSGGAAVTVAAVSVAVASVSVSPTTASLTTGQTVQLAATPKDANGSSLTGRVVSWTSSSGDVATVSGSGLVTALAAGSATITATSEGQSGTAAIAVAPAPVASVSLSPTTASLTTGQTVQLAATPKDASGNPLTGRAVTWTSNNGSVASVNGSGLVTALAAGSATITATSEAKSGTASVAVTTPATGSGECASPQPAWLWCDDFEVDRLSSYFEYEDDVGSFVRVAGAGRNGTYGMRSRFTAGQQSAGALHLAFGKTPSAYFKPVHDGTTIYRDVYWRMYLKNQAGWTGGGGDKLSRGLSFVNANWSQAVFAHVWSGEPGPDDVYLKLDPASGTDAAGVLQTTQYNDFAHMRWLGGVRSATPIFDAAHVGQWRCIEAHARLNDAGQANGVFELWIDGTLEAQEVGMNWVGAYGDYGINAVFFENYWNAGSPQAQERYFDNIIVSTQPIGC